MTFDGVNKYYNIPIKIIREYENWEFYGKKEIW